MRVSTGRCRAAPSNVSILYLRLVYHGCMSTPAESQARPDQDAQPQDSAADRAYAFVKDRIITGAYAGGTLISEGEVSAAVRISRTPVREAFLRLAAEGLLRLYPKRGALVVPVCGRSANSLGCRSRNAPAANDSNRIVLECLRSPGIKALTCLDDLY